MRKIFIRRADQDLRYPLVDPQGQSYTAIGPIVAAPAVAYIVDPRTGATDLDCFFTSLQSAASPGILGGLVISTWGGLAVLR